MPNSGATKTGGVDGRRYIAALAPQNNGRVIGAIIVAQITKLGTQQYHAIKGGKKTQKQKGKWIFSLRVTAFLPLRNHSTRVFRSPFAFSGQSSTYEMSSTSYSRCASLIN